MTKYCLIKWDKNRAKLEAAIRQDEKINDCNYDYLVELVIDVILNDREKKQEKKKQEDLDENEYKLDDAAKGNNEDLYDDTVWDSSRLTRIDNGDWQGTLLYLFPTRGYQPTEREYLMTYVGYGSCCACDALQYIQGENDWKSGLPTEQQVKDYMELCEHLVSNMIKPYNMGWRHEEEFEQTGGSL